MARNHVWSTPYTGSEGYLHAEASDISGYKQWKKALPDGASPTEEYVAMTKTGEYQVGSSFITDPLDDYVTLQNTFWRFRIWSYLTGGAAVLRVKVYLYRAGAETLLFTSSDSPSVGSSYSAIEWVTQVLQTFSLQPGDRLVAKIFAYITTAASGKRLYIAYDHSTRDSRVFDPSIVGTSTSSEATYRPFQRKCFYAKGLFWVFYSDGTNLVYRTSVDGVNWSAATTVRACTSGRMFDVYFDGTYLHYAYAPATAGGDLMYRRGTPNADGTITWSAAEQIAYDAQSITGVVREYVYEPSIAVDSAGRPWIAFRYYEYYAATYSTMVRASSTADGTWVTDDTKSLIITDVMSAGNAGIVPLTAGKMLLIRTYGGYPVEARLWDGSAWGAAETATTTNIASHWMFSCFSSGDDVYLAYLDLVDTTYNIRLYKRTYGVGWSLIKSISNVTSTSAPVICDDLANGYIYIFWAGAPTANTIYYLKHPELTATTWLDESAEGLTGNDRLTCFRKVFDGKIGLEYMTNTTVTGQYNVKFAFLIIGIPPAKFVETVYVSSIPIRRVSYKRRWIADLSVITDFFKHVYTPIVKVFKQYFVENLSILSAYIRTARSYSRAKVAQVPVSDYYARKTAYSRKLVDMAYISDIFRRVARFPRKFVESIPVSAVFKRLIRYKRRIVNTAYISEVFRKSVGFPRRFVEDLSAMSSIFKRRASYFRRIVDTAYVSDVFRRKLHFPRFQVENLSAISDIFKRRIAYARRLPQTVFISEIFKRIATFPRRLVEDLSAIRDIIARRAGYLRKIVSLAYISEVFRKSVRFPRKLVEFTFVNSIFKRKASYFRRLVNSAIISDIFRRIARFPRFMVENLSALKAILRRSVSYTRRIVNIVFISTILRKIVGFPRRFVEDLSALRALFKRKVSYFRRLVNFTFITDVFRHIYTPIVKFFRYALVENLSVLSDIFKRQVSYSRRILNFAFISEVFRKSVGFPRRFVENLSALTALIRRRASYLRKIVNTAFVTDAFRRLSAFSRKLVEFVFVSSIFKRTVAYVRRLVNFAFVAEVVKRKASYIRRLIQTAWISEVFKRAASYFRAWKETVPAREVFMRRLAYYRRKVAQIPLSTILKALRRYRRIFPQTVAVRELFKRSAAYARRLIANLSGLTATFKRSISYTRRILNLAFISEVFRKFASFPRRFVEDLSALTAAFKRRVSYLRKIVNLTFITDIFSYVYTPIIKFYKRYFVENLSVLSAVFKRRTRYTRRIISFTFISDLFRKSAGFPRKFVENLSVITAKIIIPLELKLKALKAKAEEIEEKLEEAIKKLLGAVFKL
jgi:RNAse (barnase) inhibitor barstar